MRNTIVWKPSDHQMLSAHVIMEVFEEAGLPPGVINMVMGNPEMITDTVLVSHYFGKTMNGKTINDASDFALYLLEEAHVATVTGDAFGNGDCVRISYATSVDNIKEAIARIANALV